MANDDKRNSEADLSRYRAAIDALDRELLRLLSERARQDQMACGRDGQKLGQPLDDAQDERLEREHVGHAAKLYRGRGLPRAAGYSILSASMGSRLAARRAG